MLLAMLAFIAVALTCSLFASKNPMLGFPCLIFWAIFGGQAYLLSTATWDIYYLTFFGGLGMAIFSPFAAYGLRTKKEELAAGEEYIDEGKDDVVFIDEHTSKRSKGIHDRAALRRS